MEWLSKKAQNDAQWGSNRTWYLSIQETLEIDRLKMDKRQPLLDDI
jgi:hypothetical protein